jgi:hypothetical protein
MNTVSLKMNPRPILIESHVAVPLFLIQEDAHSVIFIMKHAIRKMSQHYVTHENETSFPYKYLIVY